MPQERCNTRRQFLAHAAATFAGARLLHGNATTCADTPAAPPPVRQITKPPASHWFGYYDKLEVDPTSRYVLGMAVDFEHRAPRPDDAIRIGMVDLCDNDRWIDLDASHAWCWQQGCMLQWRPGSQNEIIWNDRKYDRYVCHILDVKNKVKRTLEHPVYSVSPDGRWAVAPDFRRLADVRPGYGYAGIPDPNRHVLAPDDTGVFHVDLNTGRQKLLVSVADVARLPYPHADLSRHKHWLNHLLVSPDGSRFTFLHRFKRHDETCLRTRMITANADGSDMRVLIDSGFVSHFIWRDPQYLLAFCRTAPEAQWGFYLYQDQPGGSVEQIAAGVATGDGHCTFSPDKQWMLYDTYPDKRMDQHVYLYHLAQKRRVDLGVFRQPRIYWNSPPEFEWRCDLHPRFSRNGRYVVIDSPHTGQGRQLHLIDVAKIVG